MFARTIADNAQLDRQALVYTSRLYLHTCLPFAGIRWTFGRLRPARTFRISQDEITQNLTACR